MTIRISVPGRPDLQLDRLLLDFNGTLSERGRLVDGVRPLIDRLRPSIEIHLLSADTFGTLAEVAEELGDLPVQKVSSGEDKAAFATEIGPGTCAAIGNGANDALMLSAVGLGIAVLGAEGASSRALAAADVVSLSIVDALSLLVEPEVLTATLRS